jgi:tRNA modification GTPase
MRSPDDTIVALSTPAGRGAIAMVRLSGPDALACARKLFRPRRRDVAIEPARATLGEFLSAGNGAPIDSGYLTFFPKSRSYTGQDVVELSCHAGPVVVRTLLEELARAGARPADPGEFTYRAVLNGRMDLPQAEAVQDLIEAGTRAAAGVAARHLRGDLSRQLAGFRETLVEAICGAEAAVEFSEEPDVAGSVSDLAASLDPPRRWLREFLATYRKGRLLRDGANIVLVGRPNAGKSSLFNCLLDAPRAIVSQEPGTTRDFLTERIDLEGIPVTLVDTAGLRETAADVERLGVERSRDWIARADLVLLLCPVDEPLHGDDLALLEAEGDRALLVGSKSDRPAAPGVVWPRPALPVSSVTSDGVAALRSRIAETLAGAAALPSDGLVLTHARHHAALEACAAAIDRASAALESGMTEEVALADLHAALRHLAEITEPLSRDELHDRIFSTFCIGK